MHIGSLDGQYYKKKGVLTSLSQQMIVDCKKSFNGLDGCYGGLTHARCVRLCQYGERSAISFIYP